jgi:hypothetical protein
MEYPVDVLPNYGLAALIFGMITIILNAFADEVPKNYEKRVKQQILSFT